MQDLRPERLTAVGPSTSNGSMGSEAGGRADGHPWLPAWHTNRMRPFLRGTRLRRRLTKRKTPPGEQSFRAGERGSPSVGALDFRQAPEGKGHLGLPLLGRILPRPNHRPEGPGRKMRQKLMALVFRFWWPPALAQSWGAETVRYSTRKLREVLVG